MFQPVSSKLDIQKLETEVLQFWKREKIFRKSVDNRLAGPRHVFYEGPPSASGSPAAHHVVAPACKDLMLRYQAMRGKYVLRRAGWDMHGLPVEFEVEKRLGLEGKEQIEKYGIAEFNARCRKAAFDYIQDWERLTDRIGFWVDLEAPYMTFTNDYIESVWWALRRLWDQGLLYQGVRVVPYCPRCGTPLADHEASLGYREDTPDPSVFVRFPLRDEPGTSLLAWTTTPWTLPGNVALAVNPDAMYARVERETGEDGDSEILILATERAPEVLGPDGWKVVGDYQGRELKGRQYSPLYSFMPFDRKAHYVVLADFVATTEGTGVVHQAPAFGVEDMRLAQQHDLPVLMTVDARGQFVDAVRPWRGVGVKQADPLIIRDLADRGLLFKAETCLHTSPFCWRCGTPLLYLARNTWHLATSRHRDQLVALSQTVNWVPAHIGDDRFGDWLRHSVDWTLGRERYWGTPLPVWVDEDGDRYCVGSVAELGRLAGRDLSDLDLHRPFIDEITFPNPQTGKAMRRVPEVIDVWFDSGAMPAAQWHYPFENAAMFEEQFPADFVCEGVDHTRGWLYSLHAISALVFERAAFKNAVCLGHMLDAEGQAMSRSRGNHVDPWSILTAHGADAFRWHLYTTAPTGASSPFSAHAVGDVVRRVLLPLWNTYVFFLTYAELAAWEPGSAGSGGVPSADLRPLDKWILSELHTLIESVTAAYESHDIWGATRPVERFVELLSNWYVRRSRRRFWQPEGQADGAALATLYECLVTLCKLLAPAMPFVSDAMYRNLAGPAGPAVPESVHLAEWPTALLWRMEETLMAEMRSVMRAASVGHAARARAGRKVRQPLAEAAFAAPTQAEAEALRSHAELLADELNVKNVVVLGLGQTDYAVRYALNPLPKQLGQKYGSRFPKVREALLGADQAALARALLSGQPVQVTVDGEPLTIQPDEVEVKQRPRGGFAVADEGGYLAALRTDLTEDLIREGLAREFARRVQDLRKSAGLAIADRVRVRYRASPRLAEAVAAHADLIRAETLCRDLSPGEALADGASAEASFDGESLHLSLVRA